MTVQKCEAEISLPCCTEVMKTWSSTTIPLLVFLVSCLKHKNTFVFILSFSIQLVSTLLCLLQKCKVKKTRWRRDSDCTGRAFMQGNKMAVIKTDSMSLRILNDVSWCRFINMLPLKCGLQLSFWGRLLVALVKCALTQTAVKLFQDVAFSTAEDPFSSWTWFSEYRDWIYASTERSGEKESKWCSLGERVTSRPLKHKIGTA